MIASRRVRLSSKGQLVVPQEFRDALGVQAGDELTVHLLGHELLVLEVPAPSPVEQAFVRLERHVQERGITREDVEAAVEEVRQEMHRERTATAPRS